MRIVQSEYDNFEEKQIVYFRRVVLDIFTCHSLTWDQINSHTYAHQALVSQTFEIFCVAISWEIIMPGGRPLARGVRGCMHPQICQEVHF